MDSVRERNGPLSGPIVKKEAEELAQDLGIPEFNPTEGWYSRLKKGKGSRNSGCMVKHLMLMFKRVISNWRQCGHLSPVNTRRRTSTMFRALPD